MNRLVGMAALLAVVVGLSARAQDTDKPPSIKAIMTKAHKGGDSILAKLRGELEADDTDWAQVQKMSQELVDVGTALGKNTPPRGEKKSWQEKTSLYKANATALNKAAGRKDKEQAQGAFKRLQSSCLACHKAHKRK
jgi:cytochrome c556